ncbi:MAG TPA: DUF6457 domain-containing protein [Gaiellaceae bacterium]|jgi:hypothetical protein|nr:DUF6457 domain-containing protein [Gaiellaceae bacterium]
MDAWLRQTMDALGSDAELSDADADALLKIAKIAAHTSGERSNAPLLCYLVGRVQGDRGLDEILEQVRRSSS